MRSQITLKRARRRMTRGAAMAALAIGVVTFAIAGPAPASADVTTYTATQTIPVPPASTYAGSGGGDGWAIALSPTAVYNVFHHNSVLTVACHLQSNAEPCWSPVTVKDESGNNFATSGHPGMYLDKATGKLYVYATRSADGTAGVVCFDTTMATIKPFCGFTALTPVGQGPIDPSGISGLSVPMLVGSHWYSFNFVNGVGVSGAENELLCFDVSTDAACAGQPFAVSIGAGTVSDGGFPSPATAAIGSHVIVPINIGGTSQLACFDDSTQSSCSGSWPVTLGFAYPGSYGSPFPLLDSTGKVTGLCLPTGTDQCFTLSGASTPTPPGMTAAIGASAAWNGPAFVLGPRVYVPEWVANVDCYDYSTGASCTNFPKTFSNLSLLYTVNPDPQRPECIWVNSDNGSQQIQNFDAYTGGACGQGPIRVLASSVVVPTQVCTPLGYTSLRVLSPERSTYSSGTVSFRDGDGNPLAGIADQTLDATGTTSLVGLDLSSGTGLPQFLIALEGAQGSPGAVVVELTWTGTYDPSCQELGAKVSATPTQLSTSLSGGGQSGATITVKEGTAVTDSATLSGENASKATGSVEYNVYSDKECKTLAASAGTVEVAGGVIPASNAQTLAPGTYYWQASYGGDETNAESKSTCGSEIETVEAQTTARTATPLVQQRHADPRRPSGARHEQRRTDAAGSGEQAHGDLQGEGQGDYRQPGGRRCRHRRNHGSRVLELFRERVALLLGEDVVVLQEEDLLAL